MRDPRRQSASANKVRLLHELEEWLALNRPNEPRRNTEYMADARKILTGDVNPRDISGPEELIIAVDRWRESRGTDRAR